MEDRISGGLQHCHETCCKKGSHHRRQACIVQRWFHRGDVVSRQVDLYITIVQKTFMIYKILWQPLVKRPIVTQATNLKVDIKWRSQENSTRSLQYIAILFIQ